MMILFDRIYSKILSPPHAGRAALRGLLRLTALLALFTFSAQGGQGARAEAEPFSAEQCEPLLEAPAAGADIPYARGLLWRISKDGKASYLFGTMHVADPEVTALPAPVAEAFDQSEQFVMEALPAPEQLLQMYGMMFFAGGDQLSDHVAAPIFERATAILSAYQLPPEAVARMKPWAAFLTMSYPPEQARNANEALDLVLLARAKQNGAEVAGLESLTEQAELFDQFTLPEQVRLLTDTVCHYELGQREFAGLKASYLKQDLGALYRYSQRYTAAGEPLYKRLMQALLVDRNSRMAERMRPMLEQGGAFIAIGALHLTGEEGVLALLEKQGYQLQAVP